MKVNTKYDNVPFPIRTYGKTELACEYIPGVNPTSARKTFNTWLKTNKELQNKLKETYLSDKSRHFTPMQVEIIVKYLGVP